VVAPGIQYGLTGQVLVLMNVKLLNQIVVVKHLALKKGEGTI
jgi:hypothetical protein